MINPVTPAVRGLARWLLIQEADKKNDAAETGANDSSPAFEKLRAHLAKIFGIAGYDALIIRARALARADALWAVEPAEISLVEELPLSAEGVPESRRDAVRRRDSKTVTTQETEVMAQLLALLFSFVGEGLALRLVRDVWPEASWSEGKSGAEDTPE